MSFVIRPAKLKDLRAIAAIYEDAVANRLAIFDQTMVDDGDRRAWFAQRKAQGFPVLVAERDGHVVGYATYGDWRPFEGFRHSREHSVYVRADARGTGVGRGLMVELIAHARDNKVHNLIAAIEASNTASISLHESLGFTHCGRFKDVGQTFGQWIDLAYMQLKLQHDPALRLV